MHQPWQWSGEQAAQRERSIQLQRSLQARGPAAMAVGPPNVEALRPAACGSRYKLNDDTWAMIKASPSHCPPEREKGGGGCCG